MFGRWMDTGHPHTPRPHHTREVSFSYFLTCSVSPIFLFVMFMMWLSNTFKFEMKCQESQKELLLLSYFSPLVQLLAIRGGSPISFWYFLATTRPDR